MHGSGRKFTAFSVRALGCQLPWVRSMCPAGFSVADDLWQGDTPDSKGNCFNCIQSKNNSDNFFPLALR